MNEVKNAMAILADKAICEFCGDCGNDEVCIKCKTVSPVTAEELKKFYKVVIQSLKEKLERENPKPLITNDGLEIMLCPHCKIDLMGEFSEPDGQEKFCPYCGGAVDFNHSVNDFVNVNKIEHIGEATNMAEHPAQVGEMVEGE